MLIFIDESGDTGRKTEKKSSALFVVSMVRFNDAEEAQRCDQAIDSLRQQLTLPSDFEFHYSRNTDRIRKEFLKEVSKFKFRVKTLAIDKEPSILYGEGFNNKDSFYKYACRLLLESAKGVVKDATVVIDRRGSKSFQLEMKQYINKKFDNGLKMIKKVKQDGSHKNNLLQVADYFASISNRKLCGKSLDHYSYIEKKNYIKVWPNTSQYCDKK